jgi:aryl-alcohol dehydrogenase-like predicted oxidoreductase
MKARPLGTTGLTVSEIGFGAWPIGGLHAGSFNASTYGATDDAESLRALETAFDLGCTFIDTADAYGLGHSEELIGTFLKGKRDRIVVATKFGHMRRPDGGHYKPTADTIRRMLEGSLKRLQTDYIDLYQWHEYSPEHSRAYDVPGTLRQLKEEGLVRHTGASIYGEIHVDDILAGGTHDVFETVQESFSVIAQIHAPLIAKAAAAGIGVIVREPLGNGLLSGRYTPETQWDAKDNRSRRERSQLLCRLEMAECLKEFLPCAGRSLVQSLITYVLQTEGVSVVIPGCKNVEQTRENMRAGECPEITAADLERIRCIYGKLCEKYGHIHPYAFE